MEIIFRLKFFSSTLQGIKAALYTHIHRALFIENIATYVASSPFWFTKFIEIDLKEFSIQIKKNVMELSSDVLPAVGARYEYNRHNKKNPLEQVPNSEQLRHTFLSVSLKGRHNFLQIIHFISLLFGATTRFKGKHVNRYWQK